MNKYISVTILLLVLVIGVLIFYKNLSIPKVRYVNSAQVFEEFTMARELKANLEQVVSERRSQLDSLQALWSAINSPNHRSLKHSIEDEYTRKKQLFDEQNVMLTNKYDTQIWERLNQYFKDYCRDNNIQLLIGKTATEGVLYGEVEYDVSADFITYINKKYAGN